MREAILIIIALQRQVKISYRLETFYLRIENSIFEVFVNINMLGTYTSGIHTNFKYFSKKMLMRLGGFCEQILNERHL